MALVPEGRTWESMMYRRFGQRLLDLVLAIPVLIAVSPVLGLVGLLVRIKLGSPILFRQQRAGLRGKPFTLLKFRTMTEDRDERGDLLPDADRLTPFGRFLRSISLDELPELWNVLKGEMSLVGPRPLRMEYLARYTPEQARRHEVKPGITGWAQINGRNLTSWEERFGLDVWYVDNCTLPLDVRILLSTIVQVLRQDGISAEGYATMPAFLGNEETSED